jgi:3-hydroxybutyryl-CoA dehydratase
MMQLDPIIRTVTRKTIEDYERVLGIGNPLHTDEAYARTTPFGGLIAHGMMSLGYVSEMMGQAFADGWYEAGELDTTFVGPVRPGDTITTQGQVTARRTIEGQVHVVCEVRCENQRGETVLRGTAVARGHKFTPGLPELAE